MKFRILLLYHPSLDANIVQQHLHNSDWLVRTEKMGEFKLPDLLEWQPSVIIIQTRDEDDNCIPLCELLSRNFSHALFVLVLKNYHASHVKDFIEKTAGYYLADTQLELLPSIFAKFAEQQLAMMNRELLIQIQHQTLLTLATRVSVVRGDWNSAIREITRIASKAVGISRVGVWFYNEAQDTLTCKILYNLDTEAYEEGFELRASHYPAYFEALQLNRVIVAPDAATHPATFEFTESYLNPLNIKSMLDAPIRLRGEMIGVVCHEQTGQIRDWSLDDQQFAAAIADLIVHSIENHELMEMEAALHQSDNETREFLEKLKSLHEISLRLGNADDFDDLCRKAVLLGREYLGFSRLGIWFINPEMPELMQGTYGIDEYGQLRDERGITFSLIDNNVYSEMTEQKVSLRTWDDSPLYNHIGDIVGHGWLASASLWDGNRVIGWISADNLNADKKVSEHDGEILKLYGLTLGHLITEIRTQSAMRESQNYLKEAESIAHLGNFVFDIRTQELRWSDEVYRIFEQPIGKKITLEDYQNLLAPEDFSRIMESIEDAVANRRPYEIEYDIVLEEGTRKQLFALARPVLDNNDTVIKIFGIVQDISERKQAEQQNVELNLNKQKLDFLRDFVEHMTHDLKTPLTTLKASSYLLQKLQDPEKRQIQLENLHRQINQLQKMIDDILTVARLDHLPELNFEEIQLNQFIRDIEQQLSSKAQQKSITIQLELEEHLPAIMGAPNELHRALMNLVENALNYTGKRGYVTLRTYTENARIICEVQDTGIGINETDLPRIFEQFYRADNARSFETGTGLGLAIVHKIVQLHKGEINVRSKEGEGSTFVLSFG